MVDLEVQLLKSRWVKIWPESGEDFGRLFWE